MAMQILAGRRFDLILLDGVISDGSHFDFLKKMSRIGMETPVVVIVGKGEERIASQLIQAGADDYLPENRLNKRSFLRIITNTLEKVCLKRGIKEARRKMASMPTRDELTTLYNREYFMEALEREVFKAKRIGRDLVLCMADLDHFKTINKTYGYPAGDMTLSEIGRLLKECFTDADLMCRLEGDHFAVLLSDNHIDEALALCEKFQKRVAEHLFEYGKNRFKVAVNISIAHLDDAPVKTSKELVTMARNAFYKSDVIKKKTDRPH
jgi:two-component system cell cycle response regulator